MGKRPFKGYRMERCPGSDIEARSKRLGGDIDRVRIGYDSQAICGGAFLRGGSERFADIR